MLNAEALGGVALFAAIALALTKHFYQPIIEYLAKRAENKPAYEPVVDALIFAEQYVQAVLAGVLCWFGGVNLFPIETYPGMPSVLGRVLTALVALFAQDIVQAVTMWPDRLAEQQYINAVAMKQQGILPISLGTVSYVSSPEKEK